MLLNGALVKGFEELWPFILVLARFVSSLQAAHAAIFWPLYCFTTRFRRKKTPIYFHLRF